METRSEPKGWKDVLKGAAGNPSPSVWEGIEQRLDRYEVVALRRSVFFYKMLAAACVSLALVAFGSLYVSTSFDRSDTSPVTLAEENAVIAADKEISTSGIVPAQTSKTRSSSESKRSLSPATVSSNLAPVVKEKEHLLLSMKTALATLPLFTNFTAVNTSYNTRNAPEYSLAKSPLLQKEVKEPNPLLAMEEVKESDRHSAGKGEERFWTSVGVAAGTFNNTTPTSVVGPASALSSLSGGQTAASETNSSGYSYTVNLAVGAKVSKRWLVHGGMSYISQLSDYTANSVVTTPSGGTPMVAAASLNQFEKKAEQEEMSILTTSPYTVNNEIQLISFPVQAGYMLVDRKVALQVNSGISTDLFLQNTITPEAVNLETTTQGRGDDSPYRPVNFSGLIGTEVSYRFTDRYRISLSPGLRYPFNSIYKSDLGIKSSPLTFDVALRFKYILK